MNLLLLAHHVEAADYPILFAMFAVGFWLGWDVIAKLTAAKPRFLDESCDSETN